MIHLKDVSKGYYGHSQVLENVSVELSRGDFLYVVGGSGAGKSTFLRMLATEELPTKGSLDLFGYPIERMNPSTLRAIRQSIGYIPQDIRLIPDLTLIENLELSLKLAGKRARSFDLKKRTSEILGVLGLSSKKDTLCRELSGGEAQRVAVARAVIRSPDLIVADEPTGSQDRDFTWSLMDLFVRENAKGCTVVIATHDMEIVRKVKKKCAILRKGKLSLEDHLCFY